MKVLQINAVCGIGSTGRICTDIHDMLVSRGDKCVIAFAHAEPFRVDIKDTYRINDKRGYYVHNALARITDRAGFFSKTATKNLVDFIKSYKPDLIHLHNLHGFYVNIKILFEYLSTAKIPIIWTLHDCWAFTGHCSHYSYQGCDKWLYGCSHCPQKSEYPQSLFIDNSRRNYLDKRSLFTSINNLVITTPSTWLAEEVRKSFLGKYPVVPIYNGIDLDIFKYHKSDVLSQLGIDSRKTSLLAVANEWNAKKGLSDLIELDNQLDHSSQQLIIVGLSRKLLRTLPSTIFGIRRTNSLDELVRLYSAADIFLNPSYEETMGMVTAEALACGTPAIVYDKTAVPEIIDQLSGVVVQAGDIDAMYEAIPHALKLSCDNCRKRADLFEMSKQYNKYYDLYSTILKS